MSGHPFEITGEDIESMRRGFGAFVTRLLVAEGASQHLPGDRLLVTAREDDPDGGVDATLLDADGSRWVPEGTSAWQFKRSDIRPGLLKKELGKPEVEDLLNGGGSYCFALGADPTARKTRKRRNILGESVGDPDRFRFYQASQLASWANEYPAVRCSSRSSPTSISPSRRPPSSSPPT